MVLHSLDEMQHLWIQHRHNFNVVNASTMIHRIGSMADYLGNNAWTSHSLLLTELFEFLHKRYSKLRPRNVANVVWAIGRLTRFSQKAPVSAEKLMRRIVEHCMQELNALQPQHVSNLLLGLAYMQDTSCRHLFPKILARAKQMLDGFGPQELSNTIWALARLEYVDLVDFLPPAFQRAEISVSNFSAQQTASVMWALTVFQCSECDVLIEAAVSAFVRGSPCSHSLAVVLWSLLQLRFRPTDRQIEAIIKNLRHFLSASLSPSTCRDLTTVSAVLADFGYCSPLIDSLRLKLRDLLLADASCFSSQDIGNFLWSLAIQDNSLLDAVLLKRCFLILQSGGLENLQDEDIRQFYQSLLHLKVFRQREGRQDIVPSDIEVRWKTLWRVRQATSPLPLWVASVLVCLEDMGYRCRGRALEQGLINTSVLDLKDAFKYAVEGISYLRTFRNQLDRPSGRYLWKIRLLESMGYEVLRVEENDWTNLSGTASKEQYLREKIQTARTNVLKKLQSIEQ